MVICSGDTVDVLVSWHVFTHASRFASFNIDSHLLVHSTVVHGVNGFQEFVSCQNSSTLRECDESWCAMISEVYEDSVVTG